MNLKDRLESIKKTNIISIKEEEDKDKEFPFDLSDIFADSKELRTIITETIASGKNIVFVSQPSIDKSLVSKYFSYLLLNRIEDVVVSEILTDEALHSDSRINIIPNPNIKEIVKILEYIMYGYKSFVFGMNFASLDNVLNKIKAAISLNLKGLSSETIETILASSNLVIVYLNKNIDGLFYISKIDKIVSEGFHTDVVTVIDFQQSKPISKKLKKTKTKVEEKSIDDVVGFNENVNEVVESIETEVVLDEEVENNNIEVDDNNVEVDEILSDDVVEQQEEIIPVENVELVIEGESLNESVSVDTEIEIQEDKPQEQEREDVVQEVSEEEKVDTEKTQESIQQEQRDIIAEITKKVNKYKLLKEKAKNKKVDITE